MSKPGRKPVRVRFHNLTNVCRYKRYKPSVGHGVCGHKDGTGHCIMSDCPVIIHEGKDNGCGDLPSS